MFGVILAHPVRLFFVSWPMCAVLSCIPVPGGWRRSPVVIATIASIAAIAGLLALGAWYVAPATTYLDWCEPSVTCIGWLWSHGSEMYPDPSAANQYAKIYGPLTFLVQAFVLRIIGPSVIASKAVGLAALALSLLCLFVACRRRTSVTGATWLVGVASLISLWFLDGKNFLEPSGPAVATSGFCRSGRVRVWACGGGRWRRSAGPRGSDESKGGRDALFFPNTRRGLATIRAGGTCLVCYGRRRSRVRAISASRTSAYVGSSPSRWWLHIKDSMHESSRGSLTLGSCWARCSSRRRTLQIAVLSLPLPHRWC